MASYKRSCLQPIQLGPLTLAHRVYLPAHSYGFSENAKGVEAFVSYIRRRMAARVPLIVIGEAEVPLSPLQTQSQGRLAGTRSQYLYQRLSKLINEFGGHIVEQLYHPGGQVWFEEQRACFAPSRYPQPRSYSLPFEMSVKHISAVRKAFVSSAMLVKQSGLSGIELKADQGKLFHQFLSREYNRRTDGFGGQLNNRMRLLLETLDEIRSNVGPSFAVGIRLSGPVTPPVPLSPSVHVTFSDITIGETIEIAHRLEESSLVDYISLSGETNSTVWGYRQNHGDENIPLATFKDTAAELKRSTRLPILLAGRIPDLDLADELIDEGYCDIVGMARAFIADAEMLLHQAERDNPSAAARPCISCNLSCVGRTWYGSSISCIYDPLTGRESDFPMITGRAKNFAVIGAGPAGMEFARSASLYGAKTSVFERSEFVGGRLRQWSKLPGRSQVSKAIEFWERVCESDNQIELIRNCDLRPLKNLLEEYDDVIFATGAQHFIPSFIREASSVMHLTTVEALTLDSCVGMRIVVVDGDRYSDPLGIASFLGKQGAQIIVVTAFDQIGVGLDPVSRGSRLLELDELGAQFYTWSDVRQNDLGDLFRLDHCSNRLYPLPSVNAVVWCLNPLPNELVSSNDIADRVHYIGDCRWPRGLDVTTKEAHDLAYTLVQN